MATLRTNKKSPYWIAVIRRPDGRQTNRSTKLPRTPANYKRALAMAEAWESGYREARTAKQFRDVLSSIEGEVLGPDQSPTVADYVDKWMAERRATTAPSTAAMYESRLKPFLDRVGTKKLSLVTRVDLVEYRDEAVAEGWAAKTVKHRLAVLRAVFVDAIRDGFLDHNPADIRPPRGAANERQPFTSEELRRLWDAASEEWRGILLMGLFTGQRLFDLVKLRWESLTLAPPELRLRTAKTGRPLLIPLSPPVVEWLREREGEGFVFPGLASRCKAVSYASHEFRRDVLTPAGVGAPIPGQRFNPKSFHSLRHTLPSLLADSGAPAQVIQQIVGHNSAAMTWHYTHVSREAIEGALGKVANPFG